MRHTHVGVKATIAVLLLAAGCDTGGDDEATPTTTTTTEATTTTTTAPPTTTTAPPLPAASPGVCPPTPARVAPRPDRPRYDLTIDVNPSENRVAGTVTVRFQPDLPTDRLVFRLWANSPRPARAGGRISITRTQVDGADASAATQQPDATTFVVRKQLAAGQATTATLDFAMALPTPIDDRVSRTGDSVRLGSFFPILAWEPGVGWATEPATSAFGEASTTVNADIAATVTVPPGLDVLSTGTLKDGRYIAENVADFALSVGRFRTAAQSTKHGVAVIVGVDQQVRDDPNAYLARVVKALEDFHDRYGPYPWPAYTLAITPNLRGGIEYPMHVMQGPGTLGRTTPHEVAHMWFYGLVANNQGRNPWLDEGLASWAEYRHEGSLGRYLAYVIPAAGKGRAGEPMTYWEPRQSAYFRSVYVQPAQALGALGNHDLVDCALRLYVARTAFRVATPKDLIDALSVVFPDAAATLARYGLRA